MIGTIFRKLFVRTDASQPIGMRGERLAARHLRQRGYRILKRNWTLAGHEADIVALDPDKRTIVIVEVKTRRDAQPEPEANIGHAKQHALTIFAAALLNQKEYAGRPLRFDAIAVIWPDNEKPEVRHWVGAFDATV